MKKIIEFGKILKYIDDSIKTKPTWKSNIKYSLPLSGGYSNMYPSFTMTCTNKDHSDDLRRLLSPLIQAADNMHVNVGDYWDPQDHMHEYYINIWIDDIDLLKFPLEKTELELFIRLR